jgi:hypothetical protein
MIAHSFKVETMSVYVSYLRVLPFFIEFPGKSIINGLIIVDNLLLNLGILDGLLIYSFLPLKRLSWRSKACYKIWFYLCTGSTMQTLK